MKNDIDDMLNSIFPNGRLSNKNQSKNTTKKSTNTEKTMNKDIKDTATLLKEMDDLNKGLQEMIEQQSQDLSSFNQLDEKQINAIKEEVQKDFGTTAMNSSTTTTPVVSSLTALESFEKIEDDLLKEIIGQNEYIKQLVIAFKRPFVLEHDSSLPKNTILITGLPGSGKHSSVQLLSQTLHKHRILPTHSTQTIDLANYINSDQEKLFLQDLFMALNQNDTIVVFEHIEQVTPLYLTMLTSLITTGKIQLNKRYVLQKGQLVEVNNALVTNAISSIKANQKYIVFISDVKESKLLEQLGVSFIRGINDFIQTEQFDEVAIKEISTNLLKELQSKIKNILHYEITFDDSLISYIMNQYISEKGIASLEEQTNYIYRCLSEHKLKYGLKNLKATITYQDNQLTMIYNDERINLSALIPSRMQNSMQEIKEELDKIVGLKEVKEYVLSLEDHFHIQSLRKKEGLKTTEVSKHMIFTGNPGTGKTTIARIISKYLKTIGILKNGQLIEVSRGDLVGRYVGHTAPLTNSIIHSAMGGVLFIDEAYSLYRGKDDSFGLEAIDTLVKAIEDYRDEFIVILAGYSKEMEDFLQANSGLKSRFPNIINFPDYSAKELLEIAVNIAISKDYKIEEDALPTLQEYFEMRQTTSSMTSGNGRMARNVVEAAILNQSKRLIVDKQAPMDILIIDDFDLSD